LLKKTFLVLLHSVVSIFLKIALFVFFPLMAFFSSQILTLKLFFIPFSFAPLFWSETGCKDNAFIS